MRTSGAVLCLLVVCGSPRVEGGSGERPRAETPSSRPASWAQPVKLEGVSNLYKVSDALYRSAQPTALGMQDLEKSGITTVVNLRSLHSDRDEIEGTGLACEHIHMTVWHPEYKEAVRFLRIVTNPERTPVLVHCRYGSDRTGTMCALYRIIVQGWTREEAIREMTEGGFGFHEVFQNLPAWITALDIDAVRRELGLKTNSGQTNAPPPTVR